MMTKDELDDIVFDLETRIFLLSIGSRPSNIDVENAKQLRLIVNQLDAMVADGRLVLKEV